MDYRLILIIVGSYIFSVVPQVVNWLACLIIALAFWHGLKTEPVGNFFWICSLCGLFLVLLFAVFEIIEATRTLQFWEEARWKQVLWLGKHVIFISLYVLVISAYLYDESAPGYLLVIVLAIVGFVVNLFRFAKEIFFLLPKPRREGKVFAEKHPALYAVIKS